MIQVIIEAIIAITKPMDELAHQILRKVFGLDIALMLADTKYIMMREDHQEEYRSHVEDLRERYKNSFIMGGSFGLALLFSLRRYFPSYFGTFSLNRTLIEVFILGGCLIASNISVMIGSAKLVH